MSTFSFAFSLLLTFLAICAHGAEAATPQPTVLTELNFQAVGATIYFKPQVWQNQTLATIGKEVAGGFQNIVEEIQVLVPSADLIAAIGFSAPTWKYWGTFLPMPKGLFDFPGYIGPNGWPTMPATGGEIFIHGKASRRDVLYTLVENFVDQLTPDIVERVEIIESWRFYVDNKNRDLTGYIDGTVNSPEDQKVKWGLIGAEDKYHINGSFAIAQKWVHDLKAFFSLNSTQRNNVFGRTQLNSTAIPSPPTAHRIRVEQAQLGYFIVRQAQPWGDMQDGNHGLFFIAYSSDTHRLDTMCTSMVGWGTYATPAGPVDELLKFTRAVRNNFYYFPSMEVLAQLGDQK